jgi:hypothetical protein
MSSLPDRSDSPRWPPEPEPQPSGINWGPVIVLAVAGPTVVAYGAILLWCMGVI